MNDPRLKGERVTLRPLEAADVPRLAEIAAEPEVARWWLGVSEAELLELAGPDEVTFVCCDSLEQARIEAGDLVEPVERGVLDWLEVHELSEVVVGETAGRQHDDDIVVFKSLGIAAEDVALAALAYDRARERAAGTEL